MDRPKLTSPDRHLDLQEALSDPLFALMDEATEAGWRENEVAIAVLELALPWLRWRREKRATEAWIEALRLSIGAEWGPGIGVQSGPPHSAGR